MAQMETVSKVANLILDSDTIAFQPIPYFEPGEKGTGVVWRINETVATKKPQNIIHLKGSLGRLISMDDESIPLRWWTSHASLTRGYVFGYDGLDRLVSAEYGEGLTLAQNCGRYDETETGYTSNGAITGLVRHGLMQDGSYGAIDSLEITLEGNRLRSVSDKAARLLRNGSIDFYDDKAEADDDYEYAYNSNGALSKDTNRGIVSITYDP